MEGNQCIETLSDWRAALHKGASIDSLLGLNTQKKQNKSEGKEDGKTVKMTTEDFQTNLNVEGSDGTSLSFHLCCPQADPAVANQVLISPPSIPVSHFCAPCFIGVQEVNENKLSSTGNGK